MKRTFPLLLLLLSSAPAPAALHFPQRQIEQQAQVADEQVQVIYPFQNTGDQKVTITAVTSSCGCTTAALNQTVYAPGEQGRLTATFTLGDRRGQQRKTILVKTDDPEQPVVRLVLEVQIPELLELRPRLLLWRPGEGRQAKRVEVTLLEEQARLLQVQTQPQSFELKWKSLDSEGEAAPRRYELQVTPGAQARQGHLTLELSLGEGPPVRRQIPLRVLGSPAPAPATQPAEEGG